jgi:MFS transporter, PHS family, inorganic phosphate transporter
VPACIALYYRLTIPETPRYTFDVARDVVQASVDVKAYMSGARHGNADEITRAQALREDSPRLEVPKASVSDFCRHFGQWKYGKVLLGTAGSWFFLDVRPLSALIVFHGYADVNRTGRVLRSRSEQHGHSHLNWVLWR